MAKSWIIEQKRYIRYYFHQNHQIGAADDGEEAGCYDKGRRRLDEEAKVQNTLLHPVSLKPNQKLNTNNMMINIISSTPSTSAGWAFWKAKYAQI